MDEKLKIAQDQIDFALGEIVHLGQQQDSGEGLSDLTLAARSLRDAWNAYRGRAEFLLTNV